MTSAGVEVHLLGSTKGCDMDNSTGARHLMLKAHPDDEHNMAFPCHPEYAPFTEDSCPPLDTIKTHLKVTCPVCAVAYRVRPRTFEHPLTWRVVFEWAATGTGGVWVYPVPSRLLLRCDSPLWSDLTVIATPEEPRPFSAHPKVGLFGPATTEGLENRGYAGVLDDIKAQAKGWSEWRKPSARLIVMAMPVTVNGHIAASAGEVLVATPWWRLSSGHAVNVYCPRFGRGVVMHHSFGAVPRPLGNA